MNRSVRATRLVHVEEILDVRLRALSDPEYGLAAQSRILCDNSAILCEMAHNAVLRAKVERARAQAAQLARRTGAAPAWMRGALADLEVAERRGDLWTKEE